MSSNFILQLKEILQHESLSQVEIARQLGVTFAALNRWINGHATPHPRHQAAIARLYKERVSYPAVTESEVSRLIRKADSFKIKGLWKTIAKTPALQDDLLLEHTYHSTSIEGTTFTMRETEAVIFHKTLVPEKSLIEHLEVTNHAAVLRTILQHPTRETLTESLIQTWHRQLMQGIHPDAGHYSKHHRAIRGVAIVLTHPTDIPEEMADLIRTWSGKPRRKTLREIAAFHVRFELIHPFGDGNGRLGRILMTLQCLEHDYPPVIIENDRKADYYDVLEYAQKQSDGPFIAFLAEEMERTRKILQKHL